MEEVFEHEVYSKNVIEFVTVANEYCHFIENMRELEPLMFVEQAQRILPLLYLKASMLPSLENMLDESMERFVTEGDYYQAQNNVVMLLGEDDNYTHMFDSTYKEGFEPESNSISENMADIYQNLKDFVMNYRNGITEIMNDALWECKMNFEEYWGSSITYAIQAIHFLKFKKQDWNNQDVAPQPKEYKKKRSFFNDRQDDINSELE